MAIQRQIPMIIVLVIGLTVRSFGLATLLFLLTMGFAASIDVLTADIKGLQSLLGQGHVTSRSLVESYLAQIDKHDGYLHAMIQIMPTHLLSERAGQMDRERRAGSIRGPLHGIPIIIKASVLGKSPTALGGSMMPSGWSAVGGQTQSAYVRGGLDPDDSKDGHSNPSGSSTGSAVAVSAGYAPVSIGAETDGSLICPAGRASLYTIKPGIGFVPQDGIVPISSHFDSAGPMAKTVYDLVVVLDAIRSKQGSKSLVHNITGSWEDISVGTLDPEVWKYPDTVMKPVTEATEQILRDINGAYDIIKGKAKRFAANVPLATPDSFELDGENSETVIIQTDLKTQLNSFLQDLNESKVRSLEDIISFNKQHADQELPTHHPRQDLFIEAQERHVSVQDYNRHLKHLENAARGDGVDHILQKYEVDVIIGPADSFLTSMATGSGYPIAGMPLSYLDFNGRAFGLAAIAGQNQEALLVKVLSAWEATFPPRKPPPMLVN
ncbi:hypothetical protein H634G_08392 [Metarhizium anisopliae BRIP 53293]|uniref:Amidase domain-containing protein n=1 Tax=Metarhizium anisopliae BRIP 53293 TaxID=1291518 RepID=A0A0D9NQK3_METAN|nr:hypothetical protein H634G_08392 [Metarhizium anisopliae BRIP 53293]KJK94101.1 hypothetical protein H633G_02035 [Metarhizium anisopliae BRIP 53284]